LALHNNSFTHAAKAIKGDRSQLAKIARGRVAMTDEMEERIDTALAKSNGVGKGVQRANVADAKLAAAARMRGRPRKDGKVVSTVVPTDPLLKELIDKYGGWNQASRALGYSGGYVKKWHEKPEAFTDALRQRARDLLDGKPLGPVPYVRKPGNRKAGFDTGELGLAITMAPASTIEKILDVAEPMGAQPVFRKKLSDNSWLIIFRFADHDDMMAFRAWAERKCEVITP
jgi:hypothetical protein